MTAPLYAIGRLCSRHHYPVIALWLIAAVALVVAGQASGDKTNDNLTLPGTGSTEATELLEEKLPEQAASVERGNRPANVGRDLAATRSKGASAAAGGGAPTGGPPAGVPANGGAGARPTVPASSGRPPHPGRPNRP